MLITKPLLLLLLSATSLVIALVLAYYMIPIRSTIIGLFCAHNALISRSQIIHSTAHQTAPNQRLVAVMDPNNYSTITYVTVPNHETGRNLSKLLINQRLAACVNIVKSIESVFEWKDKVEIDEEALLIIKSHSGKTKDLTEYIEKHHPYDCPEVITVKIKSGSKAYLNWIHETVNKKPIEEEKSPEGQDSK